MNVEVYNALLMAERHAQRAHRLAYQHSTPFWTRLSLGRAQSILMHYVVKHAGEFDVRAEDGRPVAKPKVQRLH